MCARGFCNRGNYLLMKNCTYIVIAIGLTEVSVDETRDVYIRLFPKLRAQYCALNLIQVGARNIKVQCINKLG